MLKFLALKCRDYSPKITPCQALKRLKTPLKLFISWLDFFFFFVVFYGRLLLNFGGQSMKLPEQHEDAPYYSHKNSPLFDMFIIIGLIFNGLIAIFVVLYWLDLV